MSRLSDLLALSDLKRWNVVPTSRDQTVAQHCYRVAVVAREVWCTWRSPNGLVDQSDLLELVQIIEWAMDHDGPECLTSDLPSAFKDAIPDDQLALIERSLCPWYGEAVSSVSALTLAVVGIAEAIESSSWLAQFGLSGTEPLVSDLRQKVYQRCDRANLQWAGLGAAGRQIAEQVWRARFPLRLRKEEGQGEKNNGTTRNKSETRPAITNHK